MHDVALQWRRTTRCRIDLRATASPKSMGDYPCLSLAWTSVNLDIRASSIPLSGYNGVTLVDIGDPGGGRLFRPILADWKEADGMIKSLLIGGSLALAPLSSIMAADITFTVTNEQTSGSTYTADMLVQHASGVTELVPFIATAIGQYQVRIATPGSLYTPPGQATYRVWGPGAGSGNAYQPPGGGTPPGEEVIMGGGDALSIAGFLDEQIQTPVIPIGRYLIVGMMSCHAGRVVAAATSEFHCRNSGGVHSASYGICGGTMRVTCRDDVPPPEPVQTPPSGGCSGCGGGGGGTWLVFSPFTSDTPSGTVTVGDIVNEQ
jgi:hypothetical protein